MKRQYGWKPDLPDIRDFKYALPRGLKKLPSVVDLREIKALPVFDQGNTSSCTGNATASAFLYTEMLLARSKAVTPSRLFLYYNARQLEGTADWDCGACIRDVVKCVAKLGVCPESGWPFNAKLITQKPPAPEYKEALDHQATSYWRLENTILDKLKGCLAEGYPFVFGMTVYESFESDAVDEKGLVTMPLSDEKVIGGHAMVAMGYNDQWKRFLVLNSWGSKFGVKGYCSIPYKYLTNTSLADDFWTIRTVEV